MAQLVGRIIPRQANEIIKNADGNQRPEDRQKLPLLDEVGLAGFPDGV